MQLKNEFLVEAGAEEAWRLLTDLKRVAPCMPGASMTGRDGENYLGTVKVKVGPVGASFDGTARFVDYDDHAHTATIAMSGKDVNGSTSANALLHVRLESLSNTATRVYVDTDLDITGRMAQFGRGAIADVSNRLIRQFTENLRAEMTDSPADGSAVGSGHAGAGDRDAAATESQTSAPPRSEKPTSGDLDVMSVVGSTVVRRAVGPALGFAVGLFVAWMAVRSGRSNIGGVSGRCDPWSDPQFDDWLRVRLDARFGPA